MAIAGVAIGSAGLLIALSIVHGFKSTINDKIVGFAPHITIHSFTGQPLQRTDTLETYLLSFEGVEDVQSVLTGQVMIQSARDVSGTLIKGVPLPGDITDLKSYIAEGKYDLDIQESGLPGLILGAQLANTIGADIGSRVTTYAIDGLPSPFNTPEIQQFTLTGIYQTGIDRFDDNYALAEVTAVGNLFAQNRAAGSSMEIKVADSRQIEAVYQQIRDNTQFPLITESIYQRFRNIFAWVDLQEETIPLVIGVMIIVAAFNLIGTVLMMVLERIKDIGILKTMGAKSRSIRKIFILEGFFVAITGLTIGIFISLAFYWAQLNFGIIPLSEENYYMDTAPVEPHLLDFILVAVITLILCGLASWIPARIAAKTDPVKVLSFGK
jgi:lipoprotein-releasing system permease protein